MMRCAAICSQGGLTRLGVERAVHLLADAKVSKDAPKQVVSCELPRNLTERVMRETQLFRQQFPGLAGAKLSGSLLKVLVRPRQYLEVAPACREVALPHWLQPGRGAKLFTQEFDALAGLG